MHGPSRQGYGFSSGHYGCENWTVKKAERWRIDAFELWCWRRLLRVPWTARRSNPSILKEISPGCSLEGRMLRLKLQLLWPPHAKSWLTGKDSDAGRDLGQEEKGMTEDEMAGWRHRLDAHEFEWTPGDDGQGGLACCDSWTELNWFPYSPPYLEIHNYNSVITILDLEDHDLPAYFLWFISEPKRFIWSDLFSFPVSGIVGSRIHSWRVYIVSWFSQVVNFVL